MLDSVLQIGYNALMEQETDRQKKIQDFLKKGQLKDLQRAKRHCEEIIRRIQEVPPQEDEETLKQMLLTHQLKLSRIEKDIQRLS